ncbi:MAG: VWA domain-containing protein [Candidatus Omnitrophica bacterium]|nr:VWA domain-containing protein [Candidatus Omnitrophota bacterium]
MIFKDPWVLLLLPALILYVYVIKKRQASSSLRFSYNALIKSARPTLKLRLARNLIYLRAFAIALFLIALARPCAVLEETKIYTEGIDIVLAIDSSGSMLAEDFRIDGRRQNRLEVVKKVVEDFIKMRKHDRIGMVTFAGRAYTVCPLTLDYDWLIGHIERVKVGAIEDGTAVGSAIGTSLNRLRDTESKSKIIILLTDGVSNAGRISPLAAAEAAKALGVKIYTIGAGSEGPVPYPMRDYWGQVIYKNVRIDIDEPTLQEIAKETGGRYFRATDTRSLKEIYKEIDGLEKTPIEEIGFRKYKELFMKFLIPALMLLLLELLLSNTILRKLP